MARHRSDELMLTLLRRVRHDPRAMRLARRVVAGSGQGLQVRDLSDDQVLRQLANSFRLPPGVLAARGVKRPDPNAQAAPADGLVKPDEHSIVIHLLDARSGSLLQGMRLRLDDVPQSSNAAGLIVDPLLARGGSSTLATDGDQLRLEQVWKLLAVAAGPAQSGAFLPAGAGATVVEIIEHKVASGDTLESVAKQHGVSCDELCLFNFGRPFEQGWKLQRRIARQLGCTKRGPDGAFIFDDRDKPGRLYVPKRWTADLARDQEHTVRVERVALPRRQLERTVTLQCSHGSKRPEKICIFKSVDSKPVEQLDSFAVVATKKEVDNKFVVVDPIVIEYRNEGGKRPPDRFLYGTTDSAVVELAGEGDLWAGKSELHHFGAEVFYRRMSEAGGLFDGKGKRRFKRMKKYLKRLWGAMADGPERYSPHQDAAKEWVLGAPKDKDSKTEVAHWARAPLCPIDVYPPYKWSLSVSLPPFKESKAGRKASKDLIKTERKKDDRRYKRRAEDAQSYLERELELLLAKDGTHSRKATKADGTVIRQQIQQQSDRRVADESRDTDTSREHERITSKEDRSVREKSSYASEDGVTTSSDDKEVRHGGKRKSQTAEHTSRSAAGVRSELKSNLVKASKDHPIKIALDGEELPLNPAKMLGKIIEAGKDVYNLIADIQEMVPKVGWYAEVELKLLEGALSVGLEYREAHDHRVGRWLQIELDMMLLSLSLELGVGIEVGSGKLQIAAQIYLKATLTMKVKTSFGHLFVEGADETGITIGPLSGEGDLELGARVVVGSLVKVVIKGDVGVGASVSLHFDQRRGTSKKPEAFYVSGKTYHKGLTVHFDAQFGDDGWLGGYAKKWKLVEANDEWAAFEFPDVPKETAAPTPPTKSETNKAKNYFYEELSKQYYIGDNFSVGNWKHHDTVDKVCHRIFYSYHRPPTDTKQLDALAWLVDGWVRWKSGEDCELEPDKYSEFCYDGRLDEMVDRIDEIRNWTAFAQKVHYYFDKGWGRDVEVHGENIKGAACYIAAKVFWHKTARRDWPALEALANAVYHDVAARSDWGYDISYDQLMDYCDGDLQGRLDAMPDAAKVFAQQVDKAPASASSGE